MHNVYLQRCQKYVGWGNVHAVGQVPKVTEIYRFTTSAKLHYAKNKYVKTDVWKTKNLCLTEKMLSEQLYVTVYINDGNLEQGNEFVHFNKMRKCMEKY